MIKVLLVDDEVLALEFLEGLIPWQELGYEIVGKATNGKKALAIFQEKKPQIVISDIKMAVMDGLELSKKIRELSSAAKIILLSAYKDFEYAKKGIQYGVNNYLLKHELNCDRLKTELDEIRESLEKEESRHSIIREHFIKSLIFDLKDADSEEYIKSIGKFFCFLMVQKNTCVFSKYGQPEEVEDLKCLVDRAEKLVNQGLQYVMDIPIRENNYLILYRWENVSSEQRKQEYLEELLRAFWEPVKEKGSKEFTLVVSREVSYKDISRHFQKLSKAVRYHIFMTPQTYYAVNELPIKDMDEKLELRTEKEALEQCIKEGGERGIDIIGVIFRKIKSPEWNLSGSAQVMAILDFYLGDALKGQEEVYDIEELESCYKHAYRKLTADFAYSPLIREVLAYVRSNYAGELTLDEIGYAFGMNGVYLGQMFKKEIGMTFLKYVTDYRMEKAKEMLGSGLYSVAEVAEAVGYRSGQYFSQIFLKTAGCTPQTYKRTGEKGAKKEF